MSNGITAFVWEEDDGWYATTKGKDLGGDPVCFSVGPRDRKAAARKEIQALLAASGNLHFNVEGSAPPHRLSRVKKVEEAPREPAHKESPSLEPALSDHEPPEGYDEDEDEE